MRRWNRLILALVLLGLTFVMAWGEWGMRSIWPSLVALVLVFTTRKVLMGLFAGAVAGSLLLAEGRFWEVPLQMVEDHLLPHFGSTWKVGAVIFTLLLGGLVHLLERGGILEAFLGRLLQGRSRRRVESGAGLFGLICFFDGLANSLMVGRLFRSLAAAAGVSRARLAYIVDTTSAAVACLAFISTWIAYQLAMIREGFVLAGKEEMARPYALFFASIPHNYYAWFALILLAVAIWRQFNIGPMGTFTDEQSAGKGMSGTPVVAADPEARACGGGLWRAWVPVAILIGCIFVGIYLDGTRRMGETLLPFALEKLALSFAEANVPAIFILASGLASLAAWGFFPRSRQEGATPAGEVYLQGMQQLFQPVLILVMAWMLSSTLAGLEAADYLGQILGERLSPAIFPAAVFLTGAVVAFTTGTSWGTMGLLMPLAIPLLFSISGDFEMAMGLVPMVVGAVFSGAVFGDHCSPISDTTIVSSMACGIDPMDHVRTQLPYALLAASGALLLGFLPAGMLGTGAMGSLLAGLSFGALVIVLSLVFSSR